MRIAVLGSGMVGSAIAADLNKSFTVVASDIDAEALKRLEHVCGVECRQADLKNERAVRGVIECADLVVNAVPGFMGYSTLKTVIEAGKNVVDIAFFPEDSAPLDELAASRGVVAVTDMGVAPGMCNVILGYHNARMRVESYLCLVGGLPVKRIWPWEYKAPFSPCDVIEEYVRPARYRENGADVTRPALSDPELVHFEQCGTLEAWNSDGLQVSSSHHAGHSEHERKNHEVARAHRKGQDPQGIGLLQQRARGNCRYLYHPCAAHRKASFYREELEACFRGKRVYRYACSCSG